MTLAGDVVYGLAVPRLVGLLAEMADPRTGEPQGNTPQAFSHVGRIFAANEIAQVARPQEVSR